MIATIHSALQGAVAAVSGMPTFYTENSRGTTQAQSWCRFTLLPAETIPLTLGVSGQDQVYGLAQISIFVPMDQGTMRAHAIADAILAAFPRGRMLTKDDLRIRVLRAWVQPGAIDGKSYHLPVSLRYECFVTVST